MSQWRAVAGGKAQKWKLKSWNYEKWKWGSWRGVQIICNLLQGELFYPPLDVRHCSWRTTARCVKGPGSLCPAACVLCHSSVEMRFIDPRTVNCRGSEAQHRTAQPQRSSARLGHGHRPCPDPQQMWWQPAVATAAAQIVNAWLPLWSSCVCPGCPGRCPSAQSRTCRPVGTAPNGAKVKVPQLERIKTNFTLFPTLPFCLVPFFGQLTCLFSDCVRCLCLCVCLRVWGVCVSVSVPCLLCLVM